MSTDAMPDQQQRQDRIDELEQQLKQQQARLEAMSRQLESLREVVLDGDWDAAGIDEDTLIEQVAENQRTAENAIALARSPASNADASEHTKKSFAKRLTLFALARGWVEPAKAPAATTTEIKNYASGHDMDLKSRTIIDAWTDDEDGLVNRWPCLDVGETPGRSGPKHSKRIKLTSETLPGTIARSVAEDALSGSDLSETLIKHVEERGQP